MTSGWALSEGVEPTDELLDLIKEVSSVSILAGAGAGKTEFLAQKANYLLQTGICPWPKRILCLSTKKEAQVNIKERIMKRCGATGNRFDSYTFDAFCKSIVDRFKNVLPAKDRPDKGYDIEFEQKNSNGKDKISFNDIRTLAIRIIKTRPDIAKIFSISYSHVFVDEFQDTRFDQYDLLKLLFQKNNTVVNAVGDINQSIMLWADASPTVFRDFRMDFSAKDRFLLKNYRSSKEIQDVLTCFVSFIQSSNSSMTVNTKPMNCSIHVYNNEYEEADNLVQKLKGMIDSGINEKDICVLTKRQSSLYTSVLRDKLTQVGINNLDMTELQDALKEPLGKFFACLFRIFTDKSHSSYNEFCELYLELNNVDRGDEQESKLINKISDLISIYKLEIDEAPSADCILSKINKTLKFIGWSKFISKWGQYKSKSFRDKLWSKLESHLRYTIDITNSLVGASKMFIAENCIHIMNIHKSKGLEYKVVIFLGVEDQAFWKYSSENFEDKCAIYVALSRAKQEIIISTSRHRGFRCNARRDDSISNYKRVKEIYDFLLKNCLLTLTKYEK